MSKVTVIQFAQSQGLVGLDQTSLSDFYDAYVKEIGFAQVITEYQAINGFASTRTYNSPDETVDLHHIFWKTTGQPSVYIPLTELTALEATNRDWRSAAPGTPVTATQEDVKENSFTLYPTPIADGLITVIYTKRVTDIPIFLEGLFSYEILAREFGRESKYQDKSMVDPSRFLAKLYGTLVL